MNFASELGKPKLEMLAKMELRLIFGFSGVGTSGPCLLTKREKNV